MNRMVQDNKILRYKNVRAFFIVFYIVGLAGIIIPVSQQLFLRLTPLALVLSIAAILIFHEKGINLRIILPLIIVYLIAFFTEVAGVNTGMVFGHYWYGDGLGPKIFNTPLFIGFNWVMLVYSSSSVVNIFRQPAFVKIGIASLLMVLYDVLLEQVAPAMDMWYWNNNRIPLQNYLSWFIVALVVHYVFVLCRINTKNKIAPSIFFIQFAFFLTLAVYFNLVKQ